MKRIAIITTTPVVWLLLAQTALAQDGSDLGAPEGPEVLGSGGAVGPGGSAFTGSEVPGLILMAFLLLAIGSTLVLLLRRPTADLDT